MYRILLICLLLIADITDASQIVKVEEGNSPFVQISSNDLNHIILPGNVDKAYTSTDKPIEITVEGKHAFVKILANDYHTPIEVFFIGDVTYSLILVPAHVPAETIILTSPFADKQKALSWEKENPYEQTIKNLISSMATDKVPDGYSITDVNKPIEKTRLFLKSRYIGSELAGEIWFISNMTPSELVLDEKDFYNKQVLAVAIENKILASADASNVYIIKRAGDLK